MSWRMASSSTARFSMSASVRCANAGTSVIAIVRALLCCTYATVTYDSVGYQPVKSRRPARNRQTLRKCTSVPGFPVRVRRPVRRSRTCPSSRPTTQDWQMPIRQPNGICTPAPSPASISGVAASTVTDFPLRANSTVPPWPCTAHAGRREALLVQLLLQACGRPDLLGGVQHALRPAGPGLPIAPVGHLVVEPRQIEAAVARASVRSAQPVAGVAALQLGQLGAEHQVGFRWRGMQVHDVGDLVASGQRAQHRHHRGDA